jgi:hypothetical protein
LTGCASEPPPVSDQVAEYHAAHTAVVKPVDALDAVVIGDSYGYGYRAGVGEMVLDCFRQLGWVEDNFGFGGTGYKTTANKGRCHLDYCPAYPESVSQVDAVITPDHVIVAGGRNDSIRDNASY